MQCTKCGIVIPKQRSDLGYTTCIEHSSEKMVQGRMVYEHKTAGFIQIYKDPAALNNLNRLDRRSRTSPLDRPEMSKSSTDSYRLTEKALGPGPQKQFIQAVKDRNETILDEFDLVGNEMLLEYSRSGYKSALNVIESATKQQRIPVYRRIQLINIVNHFAMQNDQKKLRKSLKPH